MFPLLTIYLSQQRGYSFATIGIILGVGSIGLLKGNLVGGWLTDKWSRKGTLIVGLVINAIGFGALMFDWPNPVYYTALLYLGYFGSGLFNPAANTVIADLTDDEQRPFAYTLQYISANFGMALGPLLGGFLAEIAYSLIFIGDVISSLICAFLVYVGIAETRAAALRTEDHSEKQTSVKIQEFQPGLAFTFTLVFFFLICPLMALEFAVPLLVKEVFNRPERYIGVIYTINAVSILVFGLLVEKLSRKKNECMAMIVSGMFWGTGLLILTLGYSLWALMICTFVWTIGEMIASIIVPTFISKRVSPATKGRFMSLIDIVRSIAGVICPIGLGYIWDTNGPVPVVYLITTLPFIAIVGYAAIYLFGGVNARTVPELELETES